MWDLLTQDTTKSPEYISVIKDIQCEHLRIRAELAKAYDNLLDATAGVESLTTVREMVIHYRAQDAYFTDALNAMVCDADLSDVIYVAPNQHENVSICTQKCNNDEVDEYPF